MNYLIASDIFGQTSELNDFIEQLALPFPVKVVNPYQSIDPLIAIPEFTGESQAYQYFTEHVGLDRYTDLVKNSIDAIDGPVTLIGFSVGASAIWRLSQIYGADKVVGALGFYSSQIRHYLSIVSNFPFHLIFPNHEASFDVQQVMNLLSKNNNVTCGQLPYLHGFMNKRSANFNKKGYDQTLAKLKQLLVGKTIEQNAFSRLCSWA
ncbi:hypothetical protein HII17_13260 [Thalassotalea sp. M1531]|uniref:Dienelactone hydrolase domain-containing protein n=1 Tax=Thalassotalea algicola TaxID=2716224 RepID=A0A7Y0LE69_9GAMM|nr:hypothetical protein [Thalassotalea algicola]NMP32532.1 hypothetical protein [Thalassotalea algicola]